MRFFSALLIGCLLLAAVPVCAGVPVSLRGAPEVRSNNVRLSDVFDGIPSDLDRDIALAPEPGRSVTYDARVLARLAEQYRLVWQPQNGQDMITIARATTFVKGEEVAEKVREKLKESGFDNQNKYEVSLDNKTLSIAFAAEKEPTYHLDHFSYDPRTKRFRTELRVDEGRTPLRQNITGRINVKHKVPVLVRRLQSGMVIGEHDIDWLELADNQIGPDVLVTKERVVGQELTRDMSENILLRSRDVMPPRLISRGNLVTLKIQTPLMLITAQGRALDDGARGTVIRVKNAQSNRIVEGVVEDSGVVRVGTGLIKTALIVPEIRGAE